MIQPLLTARKAGAKLGTSEAFCKKCYEELGGFLIGGKLRFTEESIENAIQNKIRAIIFTEQHQPAQPSEEDMG